MSSATGTMQLGGRAVELASIDVPVLVVAGLNDTLAPMPAVTHLLDLVTGYPMPTSSRRPVATSACSPAGPRARPHVPDMSEFFARYDSA